MAYKTLYGRDDMYRKCTYYHTHVLNNFQVHTPVPVCGADEEPLVAFLGVCEDVRGGREERTGQEGREKVGKERKKRISQ